MVLTQQQVAEAGRGVLAKHPGVTLGLLFGSVARGQAHAGSDVDVALLGANFDALSISADLSAALDAEVDVIKLAGDMPIPLLRQILDEGLCIYEAHEGAYPDWRVPALWRLEDEGALFDRGARAWLERVAEQGLP